MRTINSRYEVLMNGKRLANRIVSECEKMGVEDVRSIDVRKRTPFFDFLVIATVDNTVLADALLRKVATAVELDAGVVTVTESSPASDWVVCDSVSCVRRCRRPGTL
jgi:ribosomal silencing factor RsfS